MRRNGNSIAGSWVTAQEAPSSTVAKAKKYGQRVSVGSTPTAPGSSQYASFDYTHVYKLYVDSLEAKIYTKPVAVTQTLDVFVIDHADFGNSGNPVQLAIGVDKSKGIKVSGIEVTGDRDSFVVHSNKGLLNFSYDFFRAYPPMKDGMGYAIMIDDDMITLLTAYRMEGKKGLVVKPPLAETVELQKLLKEDLKPEADVVSPSYAKWEKGR